MSTMNISLPDSLKSFVDEQVSERGYGTSSEYVRELIRKDQDRQRLRGLLLAGAQPVPPQPRPTLIISKACVTVSASARTRILAGESEAGRSARACQAGCKIWPPWPDMHRTVSRQLPVARYAAQSCRGAGMRLAAGRALGRKAIRCMAGGSYRMLSPDSGRRPRRDVRGLPLQCLLPRKADTAQPKGDGRVRPLAVGQAGSCARLISIRKQTCVRGNASR